jgi:hypothetical protein
VSIYGWSVESTTGSASITYVRTKNGKLIVISIPISLGKQERRLVGSDRVRQHDSIWIEEAGEYIWLVS